MMIVATRHGSGKLSNAAARMAKAPPMRADRARGRPGHYASILRIDRGAMKTLEVVVKTTVTPPRAISIAKNEKNRKDLHDNPFSDPSRFFTAQEIL